MGFLDKWFPSSEHPAYYPMHDAECGPMSVDLWREPPIDESDAIAVADRNRLRKEIYDIFFGTDEERQIHGSKCLPFTELPPQAIEVMDPSTRTSYEWELKIARDPRSGRIVRPYIPPGLVEAPEV
ncbi:hypothetical protein H6800_01940 [Candidatus Nomurabacteria bacterium]|nr:hypothetical protein [Candidatus Nomurabacteria bacterium]